MPHTPHRPLFQKPSNRSKYDIQLIKIIIDNQLDYSELMWRCRGKCCVYGDPEASLSKHVYIKFPSGMEWFVCTQCGAGQIYTDEIQREIAQQEDAEEDYRQYIQLKNRLRDRVKKERERKRNSYNNNKE